VQGQGVRISDSICASTVSLAGCGGDEGSSLAGEVEGGTRRDTNRSTRTASE